MGERGMSEHARRAHETHADDCLALLRSKTQCGEWTTQQDWRDYLNNPNSRIAATVRVLRSRGCKIDINADKSSPSHGAYKLISEPNPPWLELTEDWKSRYWKTEHWKAVKDGRHEFDNYSCVRCSSGVDLRCHHWRYKDDLGDFIFFNEAVSDVITFCDGCHEWIHDLPGTQLKYPDFIPGDVFDKVFTVPAPVVDSGFLFPIESNFEGYV